MEVNSTNTQTILRNMHAEGDSRAHYMQMMADASRSLEPPCATSQTNLSACNLCIQRTAK